MVARDLFPSSPVRLDRDIFRSSRHRTRRAAGDRTCGDLPIRSSGPEFSPLPTETTPLQNAHHGRFLDELDPRTCVVIWNSDTLVRTLEERVETAVTTRCRRDELPTPVTERFLITVEV